MSELEQQLGTAREAVQPSWTKERAAAVRAGVERRKARAQRRRSTAGILLVTCLVALTVIFVRTRATPGTPSPAVVVAPSSRELLKLDDGSSVVAESEGAQITPVEVRPEAVTVRLASGAASFSVTPNPGRAFRVVARNVTVTVVGTAFVVSLEASGVGVRVTRGQVRVSWPGGETFLGAAEEIRVPETPEGAQTPEGSEAAVPAPSAEAVAPAAATARPAPARRSWRALAQDGEYADAFARMRSQGPASVQDDPGDLLLAADVARLGGHPEEAVPRLERVVSAHAGDSRAPLAAFTLGRTLLDQLGRPREAAQAFGTARRLDSSGALAQDALAREVESWSRAGESGLARERAEEYLRRYPKGRRAGAVRRLGGLD